LRHEVDVDAEIVLEVPQHLEAARGQGDIHLVGELTAHTPCRLRRRTGSGGVAFDEDDVLDSAFGQVIGDGRAHHTRADDDDRGAFGHRSVVVSALVEVAGISTFHLTVCCCGDLRRSPQRRKMPTAMSADCDLTPLCARSQLRTRESS
jgi:hypothetical protein